MPTVILRPAAEIATKRGRARQRFQQALRRNLASALDRRGIRHTLREAFGRIFIETDAPLEAASVATHVFGLASVSPVTVTTESDLGAIVSAGARAFAASVAGRRYAVRARRQGEHAFRSLDVERELGSALNPGARVDLRHPEVTVHVEVLEERAYLFTDKRPGAGGLPGRVQGRALVLMSGGFDSAVAAWRVMRRGVDVDYVFCNLAGAAYERSVIQVCQVLTEAWAHGSYPRLYVVDFTEAMAELRAQVKTQYWQVVLKRLFYRAAERVAAETGAQAIVTGESIGQVSSQTLANLAAIDACASGLVLRPLVGMEKMEIIAEARRIGTALLSEHIQEHCALVRGQPVTATLRERLDHQEQRLDLDVLWRAVSRRRVVELRHVRPEDLRSAYLYKREVPEGAVLLDCQPEHMYRAWHAPEARHLDPSELVRDLRRLDKAKTYVLYCTYGVQTPFLAELMQQAGYEAYAFEGGIAALRRALGGARDPALAELEGFA